MLARFRHLPLKRKLTVMVMLITGAALLCAGSALAVHDWIAFQRSMVRDLGITAAMIGGNSAAALTFDEASSAQTTLESLRAQPRIVQAVIYDRLGRPFARYTRGEPLAELPELFPPAAPVHHFGEDILELSAPIEFTGEVIGTVYLRAELREARDRFARYAIIMAIVIAGSGLVALLLATRLQRVITEPVLHLAQVADHVAERNDYSLRARRTSEDEIGQLIDRFNYMLQQVQTRDQELLVAQSELERRVFLRTADLTSSMEELQKEISERRRIADALRASETFLQSLVESLPQYIARKDLKGRYTFVNHRFCEAHAKPRAQIIGRTVFDLFAPEVAERLAEEDKIVIETGRQHESEGSFTTPGHGRFDAQIIRAPLHDSDGQLMGIQLIFWDITERKRAEAELARAHRELLETSRLAGMAEVASSVLHNVGNVLNSVNVSATLVAERAANSRVPSLAKLSALLAAQTDLAAFFTTDPRGAKVPGFLADLSRHLQNEQTTIVTEIETLRKNLEHIKDIVVMQQGYARVSGVSESVNPADLFEHALRIAGADRQDARYLLAKDFQDGPAIVTERPKVLQILVNLLRNARQALDERGGPDQRLAVAIERDAAGRARLVVEDNGVGISPENIKRIFSHGFTTKRDGHGFGLHSSAIAARELGGTLTADSDGPGRGARFVLQLPPQIPSSVGNSTQVV